jgi:peptide/nickel transport system permease protein
MSESPQQQNLPADPNLQEEIHLDDVSRVKVLSPSMLVFRRFIRNKLAIVGLIILIAMFLFSFIGGVISPYKQQQVFRKYEVIPKEYAAATINKDLRYIVQDGQSFPGGAIAQFVLAKNNKRLVFSSGGKDYSYTEITPDFYIIAENFPAAEVIILAGKGRFTAAEGFELTEGLETAAVEAIEARAADFEYDGSHYFITRQGKMNSITYSKDIAIASKLIFDAFEPDARKKLGTVEFVYEAQTALINDQDSFEAAGITYRIDLSDEAAIIYRQSETGETPYASISNLIVRAISPEVFLTVDFKRKFSEAINDRQTSFVVTDAQGVEETYTINRVHETYSIMAQKESQLIDIFSFPSRQHWLGTDGNGMDVLTRLMYGGRISLMVGFVVVFFELLIGVVVGGIAGFFGGAIDTLLMRVVDLFNSIPFYPIVIIMGAVMDTFEINPVARIFYLMAVLGILGWTGIARVVRGQILTLREQDFMVATEATGIPVARRIFRHLVPNVMPLLIVQATLALGNIIIIEATLSFLGLGVKYPIASWGSIINAATNLHVMTNYWFIWIPAGILIVLTVLGFNFVGDGLRDAFDPKMKR